MVSESDSRPSYSVNDLLLMIGQATVELAYYRARVAELEGQVPKADPPNGVTQDAKVALLP